MKNKMDQPHLKLKTMLQFIHRIINIYISAFSTIIRLTIKIYTDSKALFAVVQAAEIKCLRSNT